MNKKYYIYLPYLAWAIALLAMVGSLYFSEVRKFAPCILCWYQRICIYPLVAIIPIGILRKDKNLPNYVLPLSIIGMFISIYHNLLYYGILPESAAPCINGISCTTKYIEYFGFISPPLLSLLALAAITALMLVYKHNTKDE
jgi:disulfide bond formation protein DsbB